MDFEFYWYIIFFLSAFFGGFIDSIAGGGGIITVPVLMAANIPPHIALATNKLQGTFGSFTAALNFAKKGLVDIKKVFIGVLFTFIGAIIGTYSVTLINVDFLKKLIPIMLFLIFLYIIFSPKIGELDKKEILDKKVFYITFGIILGFYDGFFGPGTGTFWAIAIVTLLGLNLKSATAQTKIMNFTSNIASLIVFIFTVKIYWIVGLVMALGQTLGSILGSNLVIKKEVKFIKTIFLIVVAATILKIIYDNFIKFY